MAKKPPNWLGNVRHGGGPRRKQDGNDPNLGFGREARYQPLDQVQVNAQGNVGHSPAKPGIQEYAVAPPSKYADWAPEGVRWYYREDLTVPTVPDGPVLNFPISQTVITVPPRTKFCVVEWTPLTAIDDYRGRPGSLITWHGLRGSVQAALRFSDTNPIDAVTTEVDLITPSVSGIPELTFNTDRYNELAYTANANHPTTFWANENVKITVTHEPLRDLNWVDVGFIDEDTESAIGPLIGYRLLGFTQPL